MPHEEYCTMVLCLSPFTRNIYSGAETGPCDPRYSAASPVEVNLRKTLPRHHPTIAMLLPAFAAGSYSQPTSRIQQRMAVKAPNARTYLPIRVRPRYFATQELREVTSTGRNSPNAVNNALVQGTMHATSPNHSLRTKTC